MDLGSRGAIDQSLSRLVKSGNLYQLLAYLRNRESTVPSGAKHEGLLLYPMVEESIKVDVCLEGYQIRARSIDLTQDWRNIHRDMLNFRHPDTERGSKS